MRLALSAPLGPFALLAALSTLPGCLARVGPPAVGGYATVYADTVPVNVYSYPHVWYDGDYAYLVGSQWYYPSAGGWVVLRSEPQELYQYRASYGYGYPGGYGAAPGYGYGQTYRQAAPPAYRAPYAYPPPAQRVR
jgi:hypothetical protein